MDASSKPHNQRNQLHDNLLESIINLRKQRLAGDAVALRMGLNRSLVYRALKRLTLSKMANLNPKPQALRYEWPQPGQMLHMDIKKLGKIDGAGRLAYTAVMPDERKESAVAFFEKAYAWYTSLGIKVERVLTDNGGAIPLVPRHARGLKHTQ
jgi:hypothetical protein